MSAPPVVALSVEEGLCVADQRLVRVVRFKALLGVIKGHAKGRLLDGVQRLLVLTTTEVGFSGVGPRGPAE